jgi:DNA-binding response OmpR family regulator
MKILIAEDHDMTAEIIELSLRKHGFECVVGTTGYEAVRLLESTHDIAVVISDLVMPEMDGFELLAEMGRHAEWRVLPVIVLSNVADPETVKRAAELGARRFIVKPVSTTEVVKCVRAVLDEEPEALRPALRVMADLGVDREIYDKLMQRFSKVAEDAVQRLEASLSADGSVQMPLEEAEVRRLLDSAKLLGAERLALTENDLSQGAVRPGRLDDLARVRLLLRELKVLLAAIPSSVSPTQPWRGSFSTLTGDDRAERRAPSRVQALRKRVVHIS